MNRQVDADEWGDKRTYLAEICETIVFRLPPRFVCQGTVGPAREKIANLFTTPPFYSYVPFFYH